MPKQQPNENQFFFLSRKKFSQYSYIKNNTSVFCYSSLYITKIYLTHYNVSYLHALTKIEFFWSTIQAGKAIPKLVAKIERVISEESPLSVYYLVISWNSASQLPPPQKKLWEWLYNMCSHCIKVNGFFREGERESTKVHEFLLSKSKFLGMQTPWIYKKMFKVNKEKQIVFIQLLSTASWKFWIITVITRLINPI